MADIDKIQINEIDYNIKDAKAQADLSEVASDLTETRESLSQLVARIVALENAVNGGSSGGGSTNNGGSTPSTPTVNENITIPQTGTWQLKTTTDKKYVIISTDDDNVGNADYFRLLRSYGFPYTMNVEAEQMSKSLGSDTNQAFTNSDASSLFPNGVTVAELGKYMIENNLGEVTQHGASSSNLWDSSQLTSTNDKWVAIYNSYVEAGGTKSMNELLIALKEQLADSDVAQGASYVASSRTTIEESLGHKIYAVALWGGSPKATIDGIEVNLNDVKGGNYDYRSDNYAFASTRIGQAYAFNYGLYNKTRNYHTVDIQTEIDKIKVGDVEDFFAHMPFNDLGFDAEKQMLDIIKTNVDNGTVEVITPTQYYNMGEWVDNPITSITIVRSGSLNVGDTDSDNDYTVTVNYADGASGSPASDMILDRSNVNTSQSGSYTVYAYYRGYTGTCGVNVLGSSFTIPDGLKDTSYWFVYSNESNGNWYCGNCSVPITEAINDSASGTLKFLTNGNGKINGWKSTDNGATWTQVTTNKNNYNNNISTIRTSDADGGYYFNSAWNNVITLIDSSNNFEWNY